MTNSVESRSERYLRFSRRSMTVLMLLVLAIGATAVALAVHPASPAWPRAMVPLWIIAVAIAVGLQRTLGGDRWDPRSPEARAIADDEFRRDNLNRARRVALVVVLSAQLPLGLLFAALPPQRSTLAMAASTITIGLTTLLAFFLYLDRDPADAG